MKVQLNGDTVTGAENSVRPLAPGLYVVATPIGNLKDITLRALEVLKSADLIACEDRRVTAKLLAAYNIAVPMTAYHEHNAAAQRPKIVARIEKGERVALVSDAGTPLISDPGYKLVADLRAAGLPVFTIPGPSALSAALAVAGLPTDKVLFLGFLPSKSKARRDLAAAYGAVDASLVAYESPHRIVAALKDLADVLGHRKAALCRELTKRFEEVRRGPLGDLAAHYGEAGAPKGEIVLVIAPPQAAAPTGAFDAPLKAALKDLSVKEAAHAVAWLTGETRRTVYQRALALKEEARDEEEER